MKKFLPKKGRDILFFLLAIPITIFLLSRSFLSPLPVEPLTIYQLNTRLLDSHKVYLASPENKQVITKVITDAIIRKNELTKILEKNPPTFLQAAQLSELRNTFPKSAQNHIEEYVEKKGVILNKKKENVNGYALFDFESEDNRYDVYVPKDLNISNDLPLLIRGLRIDNAIAVLSFDDSVENNSAIIPESAPISVSGYFLRVISPNGGEQLFSGESLYTVSWEFDFVGNTTVPFPLKTSIIILVVENGEERPVRMPVNVVPLTRLGKNSYPLKIPRLSKGNYKVRIRIEHLFQTPSGTSVPSDESDKSFVVSS